MPYLIDREIIPGQDLHIRLEDGEFRLVWSLSHERVRVRLFEPYVKRIRDGFRIKGWDLQ